MEERKRIEKEMITRSLGFKCMDKGVVKESGTTERKEKGFNYSSKFSIMILELQFSFEIPHLPR